MNWKCPYCDATYEAGAEAVQIQCCGEVGHLEEYDPDPTPWCSGCGAKRERDCKCGPIAAND